MTRSDSSCSREPSRAIRSGVEHLASGAESPGARDSRPCLADPPAEAPSTTRAPIERPCRCSRSVLEIHRRVRSARHFACAASWLASERRENDRARSTRRVPVRIQQCSTPDENSIDTDRSRIVQRLLSALKRGSATNTGEAGRPPCISRGHVSPWRRLCLDVVRTPAEAAASVFMVPPTLSGCR